MGAAPLNWLAKIGGDTLKTKAKLLSSAINELYDDGQCKIVAVVDNTADNGKTVLITTDDNKTYSGTIANKKCEFLLPPKTLYTVQKVSSGSAEFTTKVEAGYGDCILVHLDTGYVEVKQGDIVGLDYIKAATADDLKNKVPEANAVKELNGKLKWTVANSWSDAVANAQNEIQVIIRLSTNTQNLEYTFNIALPSKLNNKVYVRNNGYYQTASSYSIVQISYNINFCSCNIFNIAGTDYKNSAEMVFLYR